MLLNVLLLATGHPIAQQPCVTDGEIAQSIEAALGSMIEEHGYPGFAYSVTSSEGPIASGGIGLAQRDTTKAMTADTIFQIGSITKTFTGSILASLVAKNDLHLGDEFEEHWWGEKPVPRFANDRPISLQNIATHTAGLPRYPSNLDRDDGDPILGYDDELLKDAVAQLEIDAKFPAPYSYSNFGYGLLGRLMEETSGMTLDELLDRRIANPIGLRDTAFEPSDPRRLATPYRDDDINVATVPWNMESLRAAGGIFSTANDLARFGSSLLSAKSGLELEARLLQQAPLTRLNNPNTGYGLGLFIVDDYVDGISVNWHGGDVDGYAGSFVLLPDHGMGFAYLTNIGFANGFGDFQRETIKLVAKSCRATIR